MDNVLNINVSYELYIDTSGKSHGAGLICISTVTAQE